jgi:hypothetical protein
MDTLLSKKAWKIKQADDGTYSAESQVLPYVTVRANTAKDLLYACKAWERSAFWTSAINGDKIVA